MRGVAAGKSDGTERLAAGGPQGSPDQPRFCDRPKYASFTPSASAFRFT